MNDGQGEPGDQFVRLFCRLDDLSNKLPDLKQRIDYVFARGLEQPHAGLLGQVERLGEVPADRLPGPVSEIWPSDHTGLAAELHLPTLLAGSIKAQAI